MTDIFLILSGLLTVLCVVPYIRDITKGRTKPRIVSWFNWTLLTGIATAAAIADKQWPSAVLTAAATIATIMVVIIGLRFGDTKIETFDVICQIGALIGLALWLVFNDPLLAIVITVVIDFIAGLPTFRHSWQRPQEETALTFMMASAGSFFALIAVDNSRLSGLLYPVYILFANLLIVALLRFSPNGVKVKT